MVCQDPTSTGTGMSRPRPLADSSAATAVVVEGVGADAVDGVGGQHDEAAALDGADRRSDSGRARLGVGAVEHLLMLPSILARLLSPRRTVGDEAGPACQVARAP